MPELAVRHCAHILYPGSRLQQEQCTPATCWADVNVQLTEQTHGRLTGPDHLAVLKMLEKVRTFSWLGCQICCSYSPKDFSLSHTHNTHTCTHTQHTQIHLLWSTTTLYSQRLNAFLKGTLAIFLVYCCDWSHCSSVNTNSKSIFYLYSSLHRSLLLLHI